MKSVVIAGYARSPFHFAKKGALARVRPDELAAAVIAGLVERSGVDPEDIEDLIVGCAFPRASRGSTSRAWSSFLARSADHRSPATTVNRFCGSSMQAIHMAAGADPAGRRRGLHLRRRRIMSRVPMMGFNPMPNPGLVEGVPAGLYRRWARPPRMSRASTRSRASSSRSLAVDSHRKAAAAQQAGKLKDEIVPIKTRDGMVDTDGCIRADTSQEALSALQAGLRRRRAR